MKAPYVLISDQIETAERITSGIDFIVKENPR